MIRWEDGLSDFENAYFSHLMATPSEINVSKQSPEYGSLPSYRMGVTSFAASKEFGNLRGQSIAMGSTQVVALKDSICCTRLDNLHGENIAAGETPLVASATKVGLKMHEDEYLSLKPFTVFVGTWNVNGESPKESIKDWLSVDTVPPDFVVVGFQELDLRKGAYLFTDTPKEAEWLEAVKAGLNPSAKYNMVKLTRLVGMMLIVFVKEELAEHVKYVAADSVGTGIIGKLGNKGGVAVRLDFHQTSICFVNCHLAAHRNACEKRNQDFNEIWARISFNQFKPPKYIKNHDHIYWIGDMNYRIVNLDNEQIKALINKKCYSILMEHDQLSIQSKLKKVFLEFDEGLIDFPPTYKYDTGTSNFDSGKNKFPAWCDRILWRGVNITQLHYRSHPTLLNSDHKPVSATFESQITVCDFVKKRKVYEDVLKNKDKLENEFLPQVTVDKLELIFDKIHFIEPKNQTITIFNTGQVSAHFEFKKKKNYTRCCKEWLTISPHEELLMPGDKCVVDFEVFVDQRTAHKLNAGKDAIYDILILHLRGGGDIFIIVSGTYVPGCFGASLEALVRIPESIADLSVEDVRELENSVLNRAKLKPQQLEIPKEIFILINYLYRYGLTEEGLFIKPGIRCHIQKIRETLDNGLYELGPCSVHSVAKTLLIFLEALAQPVIPYEFYYRALNCSSSFIKCRNVVKEIPHVHKCVFRYLIFFIRDVLYNAPVKRLDGEVISTIFGGVLLREPVDDTQASHKKLKTQESDRKKANFVYHFLVNDLDDF